MNVGTLRKTPKGYPRSFSSSSASTVALLPLLLLKSTNCLLVSSPTRPMMLGTNRSFLTLLRPSNRGTGSVARSVHSATLAPSTKLWRTADPVVASSVAAGPATAKNYSSTRGGAGFFFSHRRHQQQSRSLSFTVPIVLEQGALGERSFDIFSRLLRERIICVHGPVTDHMSSLVTAQLLFLESEQPNRPVYMYINSPGGVVTAGLAMYDTMQYIRCPVHTICMGQAASMGSLLLAGGSSGCRYSLPNARIMLHQPSGGASGMASDIDIQAKEILRTRANLNKLYVHHTGQPMEEIERVMDRDFFMDVHQAQAFGVIDHVLDKRPTEVEDKEGGDETATA